MADVEPVKTEAELEAEVAALMKSKKKKKKKKKKEKKEKKSKKSSSKTDTITQSSGDADDSNGVFSSAPNETYQYGLLLNRVYEILKRNNPEYAVKKRYVMAPPQVYRVGSTRTCWANFAVICGQMNRAPDHVLSFFLVCTLSWFVACLQTSFVSTTLLLLCFEQAELGNEGSIDGSSRLMLKGRFVPKKMESLLRKYINEYVTWEMCRSPDTILKRDPVSRLYFVNCQSCNASRAVSAIRSGYQAIKRGQRRRERR